MLELIILLTFVLSLIICVVMNISIIAALIIGFFLFFAYGLIRKYSVKEVLQMYSNGVLKVKNIVITLGIIGVLTAVWRASGTIPFIIYCSSKIIIPKIFILLTFVLCSLVSFLIGTAFGTAATIGAICMTMAASLGVNELWVGGAILSGAYFGDRCSPMSTSTLLVTEITNTDIFENIRNMFKAAIMPFILSCIIYTIAGFMTKTNGNINGVEKIFEYNFNLTIITVVPALIILVFSLFKVPVKITMLISIIAGSLICIFIQDMSIKDLIYTWIYGFNSSNKELGSILNGGGFISMIKVIFVVIISSSYAGIFEETDLILGIKSYVCKLADYISEFGSVIVVSIFTALISCNQTLGIMLTEQLSNSLIKDKKKMAIMLANSAVIMSALVPWSIAADVPLSAAGAVDKSIIFAVYLYLIPLYNFFKNLNFEKKDSNILTYGKISSNN